MPTYSPAGHGCFCPMEQASKGTRNSQRMAYVLLILPRKHRLTPDLDECLSVDTRQDIQPVRLTPSHSHMPLPLCVLHLTSIRHRSQLSEFIFHTWAPSETRSFCVCT